MLYTSKCQFFFKKNYVKIKKKNQQFEKEGIDSKAHLNLIEVDPNWM